MAVVHTLAASYVAQSAVQAGKAAEIAAERKSAKYSGSARNGVPVPTHLSGDSTLQCRVSCKHFYFRSLVVIPDIIIIFIINVVRQ